MDIQNISFRPTLFFIEQFEDDINLFYSAESLESLCYMISQELNKLHSWLAANELSLNVD